MLANDLRIGNYVLLDGLITQIESINEFGINVFVDDDKLIEVATFDELKPIDITEDILLRFRLKSELDDPERTGVLTPNGQYCLTNTTGNLNLEVLFGFDRDYPIVVQLGEDYLHHIKYLHQLQNLYFTLTNKELISNNYSITLKSASKFKQMCSESQVYQEVELYCQKEEDTNDLEVIFNLHLPLDFNDEMAQFSVKEQEAQILINVLKTHFNLK